MALQNIMQSVTDFFNSIYQAVFGDKEFKYTKQVTIGLTLIALLVGGYFGYRWYAVSKEQTAYQLFAQNVEEYERVSQEGKKDDWANVQMLFKLGYDQNPSSNVAPYSLLFQAEALRQEGKSVQEQRALLEKALATMPNKNPLKLLYRTKLALMLMDSAASLQEGITLLTSLASDKANIYADVATYYLGLYYWTQNDTAQAKNWWMPLIESQTSVQKQGKSPWALAAQEKLDQIA